MKVQIIKMALQKEKNKLITMVKFSTQFGCGVAKWNDDNPIISVVYDVEIEIEDNLVWGIDITKATTTDFIIMQNGESVLLQGKLERVESDGFCVMRMETYIITFIASGNSFLLNDFIVIKSKNISLFAINI